MRRSQSRSVSSERDDVAASKRDLRLYVPSPRRGSEDNPDHPGKLGDYADAYSFDVGLHMTNDRGCTVHVNATSKFDA